MRLQKVEIRQPNQRLMCCHHGRMEPAERLYADLDGPPYEANYCSNALADLGIRSPLVIISELSSERGIFVSERRGQDAPFTPPLYHLVVHKRWTSETGRDYADPRHQEQVVPGVSVFKQEGETPMEAFTRAVFEAEALSVPKDDFNRRKMADRYGSFEDYRQHIDDTDSALLCDALREALPDDYDTLISAARAYALQNASLRLASKPVLKGL